MKKADLTPRGIHTSRLRTARSQLMLVPDRWSDKHPNKCWIGTESAVADLLANLMHFCASLGIDFEDRLRMASYHHSEERAELGQKYLKRLAQRARRRYEEARAQADKMHDEGMRIAKQSREEQNG